MLWDAKLKWLTSEPFVYCHLDVKKVITSHQQPFCECFSSINIINFYLQGVWMNECLFLVGGHQLVESQADFENEVSVTDKSLFSNPVSAQRLLTEVCTIALDTRLMSTKALPWAHIDKSVVLGHLCSANGTFSEKVTIRSFLVGVTNFKFLLTLWSRSHW